MSSMLDMISQQLGGNGIAQLSRQLGTDEATTSNAVQMALPVLVGGLAHNAQSPQGAAALSTALNSHDPGLLDNLGSMLGGGGGGGGAMGALGGLAGAMGGGGGLGGMLGSVLGGGAGASILGHVLGQRQAPVEQGLGRATGMNQQQIGMLLAVLAPIVMSALAKRRQQTGATDPGQLGQVLQQERQQVEQRSPAAGGLLGKIFAGATAPRPGAQQQHGVDLDGDGIADEIAKTGPSLGGILGGLLGGR